jgi:hypothetical protein
MSKITHTYVEAIFKKYINLICKYNHEKLIVVWNMIWNSRYEYMIMYTRPKVWVASRNMNSGTIRKVKFSYLHYVV